MLVHFEYKPLSTIGRKKSWAFKCYYKQQFIAGTYHYNGDITWQTPPKKEEPMLKEAIHDLMLYHVYESEHQPAMHKTESSSPS
ncbi:DUF5342 family protein [Shouchella lonarensis]|uniref:YheE like protein n=1 Tax=Shouchella lonarensis TaxID=1464122 RepID=A0A1G6JW09_9BACI|nr:DUF5342 family protein [Shouchella lonarensis]SDC22903.1 hypothetical protein SAMN05421737_106110 [Shouchella lonarensis]